MGSGMYDLMPVRPKRSSFVKFTDEMEQELSAMRDLDKILTSWKRAFRERSEAYERIMSRTLVLLLQGLSASLAHAFFSNVHAMVTRNGPRSRHIVATASQQCHSGSALPKPL